MTFLCILLSIHTNWNFWFDIVHLRAPLSQQHQPLGSFVIAPIEFIVFLSKLFHILEGCAVFYCGLRKQERALKLLTHSEWSRAFLHSCSPWKTHNGNTRCLQYIWQRVAIYGSLFTYLSSWQHSRKSMFRTMRRYIEKKEQTNRLQHVSRSFMLCPILCRYVAIHRIVVASLLVRKGTYVLTMCSICITYIWYRIS